MRHDPRLTLPPELRDDPEAVLAAIGATVHPPEERARRWARVFEILDQIADRQAREAATIAPPEPQQH